MEGTAGTRRILPCTETSQPDGFVAGAVGCGLLDERGEERRSIAGQIGDAADRPLLRMAIGEEVEAKRVHVAADAGFTLQLVVGGQAAEAVHLVAHLRGRNVGRAAETGIE